MTHHFNAQEALLAIRQVKALCQPNRYRKSRLQKYRAELVGLRQAGATYSELVLWLWHEKHFKVTHTTVIRYLAKLPELRKEENAELS